MQGYHIDTPALCFYYHKKNEREIRVEITLSKLYTFVVPKRHNIVPSYDIDHSCP